MNGEKRFILVGMLFAMTWGAGAAPKNATPPPSPRDSGEPSFHNKSLSQWTSALGESNPEIRVRAANAIGQMDLRARSAAPQLAEMMTSDPDVRVRQEAARAILALGSAARPRIPALIEALNDVDQDVRLSAAAALGAMGPDASSAAPAIGRAVSDADPTFARAAALALARLGPAGDTLLVKCVSPTSTPQIRLLALTAMTDLDAPSADDLLTLRGALSDASQPVRLKAAEALEHFGPLAAPATGSLTTALADSSLAVRAEAAQSLAAIGPPAKQSLPALRAALILTSRPATAPSSERLRVRVAQAIWSIARDAASTVPIFISGAANDDPTVRACAIRCLGQTQSASLAALQVIVNGLNDIDGNVRFASIDALGRIGPPARAVAGPLREMMDVKQPVLALLAAGAIWRIDQNPSEVAPLLNDLLGSTDPAARDGAISGIGELGISARGLVPQVREGLKDDSLYVRISAAVAEWRITGDPEESVAALVRIAGDRNARDPYPRIAALTALGKIGPAAVDARSAIHALESDDSASVRAAAMDARGKIEAPSTGRS